MRKDEERYGNQRNYRPKETRMTSQNFFGEPLAIK